jgi:hypothetical protein
MPESRSDEGLVVTYDEESLTFSFDWNPETHPEYNFLEEMTSSELLKMLTHYLELTDEKTKQQRS